MSHCEQIASDWTTYCQNSPEESARRLQVIGIPHRFRSIDPLRCDLTPAVTAIREYAEEDFAGGRCLLLSGPTGVGKTFAAVVAVLLTPYCFKRFWYFPGLCSALLDPERRALALEDAKTVQLAIWDDFGTEYLKTGGLLDALIDELVWTREAEERATIITTNLTPEQLRERLSDRIVDRFRGEWGRVVALGGSSLR